MGELAEAIQRKRGELGWTQTQLAQAAGCSKAYLSEIENQKHRHPPSDRVIEQLERAMNMVPGELKRLADWQSTPAAIREDFVKLSRQLEVNGVRRADGTMNLDAIYRSGRLARYVDETTVNLSPVAMARRGVPLINKVAAGYPSDFTDLDYPAKVADEYVASPATEDPQAFAARVVGQSMMPEYREGDILVFSPARTPADGADCFVRLLPDHQTTFKRVFFETGDRVRLQPLNPAYQPRVVGRDEIDGLYPAMYRIQTIG